MPVNGPAWLQIATTASVTFMLLMVALLLYRLFHDTRKAPEAMEIHVSPYIARAVLLSQAEQRFYFRLFQAMGSDALICPKVHLASVIDVRADAMSWQAAWNRIAAKRIDFLLVAPDTYKPLLAIMLEGERSTKEHTEWMDRALLAAGLPVLRFGGRPPGDAVTLRKQVDQKLNGW